MITGRPTMGREALQDRRSQASDNQFPFRNLNSPVLLFIILVLLKEEIQYGPYTYTCIPPPVLTKYITLLSFSNIGTPPQNLSMLSES